MHPALETHPKVAQRNFSHFLDIHGLSKHALVGLRTDPRTMPVLDLINNPELKHDKLNDLSAGSRINASGIILPRNVGGFLLSADCFPVSIQSETVHAVAHIGDAEANKHLLELIIAGLDVHTSAKEPYKISLGPGIRFLSRLETRIIKSIISAVGSRPYRLQRDDRDTFWDSQLFSYRYNKVFGTNRRQRGNHVAVCPPY